MTNRYTQQPTPSGAEINEEEFSAEIEKYIEPRLAYTRCIKASLYDTYVELETNPGQKKLIDYTSFKTIINNICKSENSVEITKGLLPPSNMIFLSQSSDEMCINCYYPEGIKPLQFDAQGGNPEKRYTKMDIIVPNIILSVSFKKDTNTGDWLVSGVHYLCTPTPVSKLPNSFIRTPDRANNIFVLPMSNTYDNGNMCYGSNQMPARFRDGNLRGIDWYYRYLWESPFNSDLGIIAIGSEMSPTNWYKLLNKIASEKDPVFPYNKLKGFSN